jgi:hypothetical protein
MGFLMHAVTDQEAVHPEPSGTSTVRVAMMNIMMHGSAILRMLLLPTNALRRRAAFTLMKVNSAPSAPHTTPSKAAGTTATCHTTHPPPLNRKHKERNKIKTGGGGGRGRVGKISTLLRT